MDTTVNSNNITENYTDFYKRNSKSLISEFPGIIKSIRDKSIEELVKQGIPEKKSERYKYTYLLPFFEKEFKLKLQPDNFNFELSEVFKCDVPYLDTDAILLINGFYYQKNKINGTLPDGIWIGSIRQAFEEKPEIIKKHFGKYSSYDDGFIAMNGSFFMDGFLIYVPKNQRIEKPLQIINIMLSDFDILVNQRNLIVLDDNSYANIVICDHTLTNKSFFSNSVTEVFVGENAVFNQTNLQNENNEAVKVGSTFIYQKANSRISDNIITLHGGTIRNNVKVTLDGEGGDASITGLYLTDQTQHVDNYIFVNHAKPHCTSNQLFKGIMDDNSTGSFYGRILVSPDAQKTMAYQKSSNLLLTTETKISARPQLEIYADDVKCSHGGTVGQLDQEALFYLRSRGISKAEAKLLLMFAFAHEIIENIAIKPLKERIDELVNRRLRGELARCQNCTIHCC